jgi:GntR family transcriptional regulator
MTRRPAHARIEEELSEAIGSGKLPVGTKLAPERDLAAQFGVSRMTLRQALGSLERSGLLRRAVGRNGGTFVAAPKVERDLTAFAGLSEQLRRQGFEAGARVRRAREASATPAVAEALGLVRGAPVYEIVRVRLASGEPVALERTYFSAVRFPGLIGQPLEGSLYDLLRERYGEAPTKAHERLEPVLARPSEARALGVEPGAPLMRVERVAYAQSGEPIELSRELHRGDRTSVVVWVSEVR